MKVVVKESDIAQLKNLITEELGNECDDEALSRFIRAAGGNLKHAGERLMDTMQWRKEFRPETIECHACIEDSSSHYMQIVGYCPKDRPVFYSCMALSPNKDFEAGKAHMVSRFEQAIRMMPKGVEEWIWVSDFHGFGIVDLNPSMARLFVDLLGTHYPERLGLYFLVDTPKIFQVLWKIVKPWLDPVTAAKLVFVPNDADLRNGSSKLRAALLKHFDEDLADWLIAEIRENRSKAKTGKRKIYSSREIHKEAVDGNLVAKAPHDLRGTERVLQCYNRDPALLLPIKHSE